MTRILPALIVSGFALAAFAAVPASAQQAENEDGVTLMERGAQLFLEGILREIEPALDDLQGFSEEVRPKLRGFLDQMGPALADLMAQIEDFSVYHPPEILPNGDIILRRKTPDEIERPGEGEDGEIEI
jgi:hypothetical protein